MCIETSDPSRDEGPSQKRILIALDHSDPAEWALKVGGRLAEQLSARFLLLHVIQLDLGIAEDFVTAQKVDALNHEEGLALLERADKLLPAAIPRERLLQDGGSADEICRIARDWKADFVVMGTRGRGRIAQFVLGSTSESVIRRAPCPVVTVGHDPASKPHLQVEHAVAAR